MNWGYKIAIVIFLFIIGMLSMVLVAYQQTNDMVDNNYYEKELKYQTLIDAAENLNKVTDQNLISQKEEKILIQIPISLSNNFNKGEVEFIRSDNQKMDVKIKLEPDNNGSFFIEKSKFSLGFYKARLFWNNEQTDYYKEQDIMIR